MRSTTRVTVILFLSALARIFGQEEAARIETQDIYNRDVTPLEQQPAAAPVSDPDLGDIAIVLRQPRPKMFSFSTNQSLNFTTNAFLTQDNREQAFFWNGRADASFVPFATRDFTPRLTLEQNWFRYDHFSELDFDSQSAILDLKYDLTPDDRWFVDGSYSYSRLYSQHPSIGQFYKFGLLNFSLSHVMSLQQLPLYFAVTAGGYWRQGEPSIYDRIAPYLSAAAIYSFTRELQLTAFVRPELQFYTNDPDKASRKDVNLTVGSTLSYTPVQYVTLAATASYIGNYSSEGARGYNVFTPSVILSAAIAF